MADVFERNVYCLLGLPFDAVDMMGAVRQIRDAATHRQPCLFSTPNLNFVVACLSDEEFRDSVIRSDFNTLDSMPLVWVARWLGIPIRDRVTGSGMFETLRHDRAARLSVYFYGGPEGVAEAACNRLNLDSEGLVCVGFEYPGLGSVEEMSSGESVARINASGADFVVVSLGAKKGQAWIDRNRARLSAPVISHLGAVINFVAGTVRRAPMWMQRAGLEWLWRVKEEPGLWRRYFHDGLAFLRLMITCVVPYAWFMYRHKPARQELDSAAIDLHDEAGEIVIRMRGAWVLENLRSLRECFSRPALVGREVRLVMEHVTYVDSAFIGLLMLLYGDRKRQGRRLSVGNLKKSVRPIFRYSCAEFLLDNT